MTVVSFLHKTKEVNGEDYTHRTVKIQIIQLNCLIIRSYMT